MKKQFFVKIGQLLVGLSLFHFKKVQINIIIEVKIKILLNVFSLKVKLAYFALIFTTYTAIVGG